MNILHVTQNYYPSFGGTQHTIKKVSEYLHATFNDDVTVYTTNSLYGPNNAAYKKIEQQEEWINGVFVKRFDFLRAHKPVLKSLSRVLSKTAGKPLPYALTDLSMGPVSSSLKRAILNTEADVVCASSVHYRFAGYGIYRRQAAKPKPFVLYGALHLSDGYVPDRYMQRINAADRYIANTAYEKEYLIAKGVPGKKIEVIGAATDVLNYAGAFAGAEHMKQQPGIPAGNKIILYIGRQEAFKGIPVLLSAFEKLQPVFQNITLIIAGAKGTYTETLQQYKNNDIKVLTDISNEDKCSLLAVADVVVLPSKEESFGVVFLEAWSFKKPVIGTNIGAIASLVEKGKDGLLFEAGNAAALAEQLKIILQNPERAALMGQEGYAKVQRLYTWDVIATRFRKVYENAIEDFKSRKN